ncbi:MAG: peptidoglycan DD-metalloendopeptidase family protein [Cyanobacteria bacterium J06635_11]
MTAPQHSAKPQKNRETLGSIKHYKLQRCWFLGMGLLSSFGFVASQMGLAFAYSAADLALNDYAAEAGLQPINYSVTDTTFALAEPAYEAPTAQPVPDAFIEAPTVSVESWAVAPAPAPPAVDETAFIAPASTYQAPTYSAPATPPAPQPTPAATAPSAPAIEAPEPSAASVSPVEPSAAALTPTVPAAAQAARPAIAAEQAPESLIAPQVTPVAAPAFSVARKDVKAKLVRRGNPLIGMIEASAVATPIILAMDAGGLEISADVPAAGVPAIEVAPEIAPPVEAAPEIVTPPAAIPDIVPAAPVEAAAPPAVDIAPIAEEAAPIQATELVPASLPEGTNLPEEYNSVFVDPTDYSIGATQAPDVVVSEQSTGCEFTVGASQAVPNGACGTTTANGTANGSNGLAPAPAPLAATGGQQTGGQQAPIAAQPAAPVASAPVASSPSVNVGPVSFSASGIRYSAPSTTAAGRDYLNRSVRPLVNLQAAQQFIFPLSVPSPITSLFGFRVHPITGDYRFHGGTDIGAAQGTPVLATQDGVVAAAANAGGYGLMVVLNHELEEMQLQSRYAHLSEILVEAGSKVKKGDVIGLVGSTGNSTGPHLHFEMMQATADGWVLVNADGLVQNSLANLVKALNNPMQAVNFSMADFKLNRIDASQLDSNPSSLISVPSPGQDGIPFRPAQPNAS